MPPFVVRYLTTNVESGSHGKPFPFALRYRRVNTDQISVVGQVLAAIGKSALD